MTRTRRPLIRRLAVVGAVIALVALVELPAALAQYGSPGPGPSPSPSPSPSPTAEPFEPDVLIELGTENADIEIGGNSFGPNTPVNITYSQPPAGGSSQSAAGSTGDPAAPGASTATAPRPGEQVTLTTVTADAQGSFTTLVSLPGYVQDMLAAGEALELRVSGTDGNGRSATVVRPLSEALTAPAGVAQTPAAAGPNATLGQALLAALVMLGGLSLLLLARARSRRS